MGKQDVCHGINLNYVIYFATYGTENLFRLVYLSGNDPHKIRLKNTRWK